MLSGLGAQEKMWRGSHGIRDVRKDRNSKVRLKTTKMYMRGKVARLCENLQPSL